MFYVTFQYIALFCVSFLCFYISSIFPSFTFTVPKYICVIEGVQMHQLLYSFFPRFIIIVIWNYVILIPIFCCGCNNCMSPLYLCCCFCYFSLSLIVHYKTFYIYVNIHVFVQLFSEYIRLRNTKTVKLNSTYQFTPLMK
jgi:hypothetical protein